MKILVLQTAFLGDVILTLPLLQALRTMYPTAQIDAVVTPAAAGLLEGHPAVDRTVTYDKRGSERGVRALVRFGRHLRSRGYDLTVSPHKSLRTGILVSMAGSPVRIGFADSAVRSVFTRTVVFDKGLHEIDRNLKLLESLSPAVPSERVPRLYPPAADRTSVEHKLRGLNVPADALIAVAPGSIWFTKRWPPESFAELLSLLEGAGWTSALVGGVDDRPLCEEILRRSKTQKAFSVAGEFSLLQSAVLIGLSRHLVTNDSAPMHLGVAMGTPVTAIFGPTIPSFGFAPRGEKDAIFETEGLRCRPCSTHGGVACPVRTFDCMKRISPASILHRIGKPAQRGESR